MTLSLRDNKNAKLIGPNFIALQVRDLDASKAFYVERIGLTPIKCCVESLEAQAALHAGQSRRDIATALGERAEIGRRRIGRIREHARREAGATHAEEHIGDLLHHLCLRQPPQRERAGLAGDARKDDGGDLRAGQRPDVEEPAELGGGQAIRLAPGVGGEKNVWPVTVSCPASNWGNTKKLPSAEETFKP